MIAFFPSFYPDELLYSLFARYYAHSGYTNYRSLADDIMSAYSHVNILFANKYSPEVMKLLTRFCDYKEVIEKHTMINYYARFVPAERRKKAVEKLINYDSKFCDYICVSRNHFRESLRYCPICASEDRALYGEAYWHRAHQIFDIRFCTKHQCLLEESNVFISSKGPPNYASAEMIIPHDAQAISISEVGISSKEIQLADYALRAFNNRLELGRSRNTSSFLINSMQKTEYYTPRQKECRITKLAHDFFAFYSGIPISITAKWQIQKTLQAQRFNFYEVCLIAYFLGVSADDLCKMKIDKSKAVNTFDSTIFELHAQGLNYAQIARKLNASYDVVKMIGIGTYRHK